MDLPQDAVDLLVEMKCDGTAEGSIVDLNDDGEPEYQVSCFGASHGRGGSVIIGKVRGAWTNLTTAERSLMAFDACQGLIVLKTRHEHFHDLCLPHECAKAPSPGGGCRGPAIWTFRNGSYRLSH